MKKISYTGINVDWFKKIIEFLTYTPHHLININKLVIHIPNLLNTCTESESLNIII